VRNVVHLCQAVDVDCRAGSRFIPGGRTSDLMDQICYSDSAKRAESESSYPARGYFEVRYFEAICDMAGVRVAVPTRRSLTAALLSLVLIVREGTSDLAAQDGAPAPFVAAAQLIPGGPAVYLGSGLLLTAAHVVNPGVEISVVIAGAKLPVKVLKQGIFDEIDLSLLQVDQSRLPPTLPTVRICSAPPWPGDPVIVISSGQATRSTIVPPSVLPSFHQHRFPTLIKDVATTGNSGSGVFDPAKRCLLGIMSRKFTVNGRDIAKYFVSADLIRAFMKGVELPKDNSADTGQAQ
jgi:trypsin-like peptidase